MFGRKRTTVGLDIGSGLIKLVVIQHGGGEPVLTKVAFTSVVDDAIVEGEVMDPGIVAEAIMAGGRYEVAVDLGFAGASSRVTAIPTVNEGVYRWRQLSSRSPIGVIGDAGTASAEKGEKLLTAISTDVAEARRQFNRDVGEPTVSRADTCCTCIRPSS